METPKKHTVLYSPLLRGIEKNYYSLNACSDTMTSYVTVWNYSNLFLYLTSRASRHRPSLASEFFMSGPA